jgi:AraC-like DNA-binding protein
MSRFTTPEAEDFYYDRSVNARAVESTEHYHTLYELYYMQEGRCNYFIDDRSYRITQNDLLLIPSGIIHKTNYTSRYHSRALINFSQKFIPPSLISPTGSAVRLFRSPVANREVERLLSRIEEECNAPDDYSEDALRCYVGELLFIVLRAKSDNDSPTASSAAVESAVRYIRDGFSTDISLSAAARTIGISPEHLSRLFKSETGFGFNEYLNLVRLKNAEYLLQYEPHRSISDIAYACGFNDSNYFSDKFKRAFGIPPSQLRQRK